MRMLSLSLVVLLLSAVGCSKPDAAPEDILLKKPPPMVKMTSSPGAVRKSGVKTWDLQVGTGAPIAKGQRATIHYVGWLADGTRFDSTRANGRPYVFTVGAGDVIPGMSEGIVGMKLNGKRRIEIPAAQAYGDEGRPPVIPGGSTLLFDVELQVIEPAVNQASPSASRR